MDRTYLGGRVLASRRVAILVLGDLLGLLLFAGASAARHGGTIASLGETAAQFGVGWFVVATATGAYGPLALGRWRSGVLLGAAAWSVGAVVGALVRVVTEPGAGISPVFVLVTAGVGAGIFGVWRGIAAAWL